jgi:predicted ATPase
LAQHPFLKSIRPVNLLSFGPETEEIELRPLNILIGANGSGKSNLIEILRLLYFLPEKEPWVSVLENGGVDEWIWKGEKGQDDHSSVHAKISFEPFPNSRGSGTPSNFDFIYLISLDRFQASFRVAREVVRPVARPGVIGSDYAWLESNGMQGAIHQRVELLGEQSNHVALSADRSVLSQLASLPVQLTSIGLLLPELYEIGKFFDSFDFHQDWEFGADLTPRDPIPVGQPVERLEENARNLAQMLTHYKDYHRQIFDQINEQMRKFYEPLKSVDVRLIGTHLQVVIHEEGGFSIPAYRLSDGTLRWLALLTILLNPSPAPVTCIEEPELGLHPDIIPTLADLLRDASTRTQLILTTHSRSLVECFSDDPGSICVCEKFNGATEIKRLEADRMKVWLDKYSLGQLWSSGEIGGNRW